MTDEILVMRKKGDLGITQKLIYVRPQCVHFHKSGVYFGRIRNSYNIQLKIEIAIRIYKNYFTFIHVISKNEVL